jgi:hypothetical protein
LVERLATLLPEPLVLQAKGSLVHASCPNGLRTEMDLGLIVNQPGALGEHLIGAAHSVLSSVQDFVVLNIRSPWPVAKGAGSTGGTYLPLPGASIEENELRLWYGEQPHPVIDLTPLPLPNQGDGD